MNNKLITAILLFFLTGSLCAQSIQLLLNNPSPFISDWQSRTETAILIVNNTRTTEIKVKIKGELYDENGALLANTEASKMPELTIPPGVSKYNAEDIFPLHALSYKGVKANSVAQTGRLPDDNYRFCISITDPQTGAPVNGAMGPSGAVCKMFSIIAYQAPILIAPRDNEVIPETRTKGIMFRWSPVTPSPKLIVTYRLQIWEVLQGQTEITAIRSNQPIIEKDYKSILQSQWPVDFAAPETGKKYAWTITPLDDQERKLVDGYGFAQPRGFKIAPKPQLKSMSAPPDSTAPVAGTGTAVVGDTLRAGLNGEFKVIVSQITTETDGSFTGEGKVHISWLKTYIAVEFKKIRVDSTKLLTSGAVVSVQSNITSTSAAAYPQAWGQSWLAGPWVANKADGIMNWSNNKLNNVISYVNNNVNLGQPAIPYDTIPTPAIPGNPLKMPFGIQFYNGADKLIITEFIFKPNESKINFLAQAEFAKSGTVYQLGFAGKYFKIRPNRIDFSSGRVELVEDFKMPNVTSNPKMKFTFKKGTANSGCYIQWANSGITDISLGLEVKFTRGWLLPIPASSDSVMATLSGNGTSMQDILLTGNLPNCEIVGANGLKIQASQISLDLSDIRNPSTIIFPVNYPGTTDVDWQGFYLKTFSLTLPDNWKTGTNQTAPVITASDLIIDDMGVSVQIKAVNILSLQTGNVAELAASLDTIKISLVNSSLVNGKAIGKVILPISDNSVATNSLLYTATFAQSNSGNTFQMVIVPIQPIKADVLKGSMTLNPTSNITAAKTPGLLTLSIKLNGTFKWDNPNLAAPVMNIINSPATRALGIKGIKMEMGFENLSLTYKNYTITNVDSLKFNCGTWSFASPQKLLANFPVTIKKFYYKSLPSVQSDPNSKELFRGALMIDIVANLTEDIGGSTTVGAAFAIERNNTTKKFIPKYKGVFIDSIEVHADLSAVKIHGTLVMYDNDPKFGDGFKATLGVTFTAVSLQVNALAQFGSTTYLNNNQFYRYWRVEADVKLPVGVPFLTGVGFYGFGGGAFYNMKANVIASIADPGNTAYTFEPKKSALGFMVKATVATMPKFETFNTDVSLLALFSSSGGLTEIGFLGNFWLAAKLAERPAAKIKGSVAVSYNFPDKIFFMGAGLLVNVPPSITTPGPIGFVMNINGRTNKWYFKCGIPSTPNAVNVFGISMYEYLMFGNEIPVPNGFTNRFRNNYFAATATYPNNNNIGAGGVGVNTATGKGFATGIGIEFTKDLHQDLYKGTCRKWSIDGNLLAGAELNLSLMDQTGCIGINGYRASGNLGLYGSVDATIKGTSFKNVCDNKSFSLFKIQTGAWLDGKFPNPEYIAGSLTANINLFGGLCQVSYYRYFEKGTNCYGTEVVTANAAQEDKAGDLKNKLIQYVAPATQFNFPIASTINVKYALVPGQVFDVAENAGDGTIKNRTFKLIVTRTLEVKNVNGVWLPVIVQTKVNNTGEYQYYIKSPLSVTATQSIGQIASTAGNLLNSSNGNILLYSNGAFKNTTIATPVPPPPTPNYPNPVPDPVNSLVADMDYRFVVTATLKELTGTTWSTAVTKTGAPVTETKTKIFRTGSIQLAQVNTTAPKSK